jgi:hypothetical protein
MFDNRYAPEPGLLPDSPGPTPYTQCQNVTSTTGCRCVPEAARAAPDWARTLALCPASKRGTTAAPRAAAAAAERARQQREAARHRQQRTDRGAGQTPPRRGRGEGGIWTAQPSTDTGGRRTPLYGSRGDRSRPTELPAAMSMLRPFQKFPMP